MPTGSVYPGLIKRKFFYSRNLNRPKEYKGQDCEPILADLPQLKLVYEKEFESKHRGKVSVSLYKLPQPNEADNKI